MYWNLKLPAVIISACYGLAGSFFAFYAHDFRMILY